jgi:ATP synthase protein I
MGEPSQDKPLRDKPSRDESSRNEPSQDDLDRRRAALEAELRARRPAAAAPSGGGRATGQGQALGQAMRVSAEFVAGLAVGAALGYGADRLLGTSPWCFILFFLLGFAASVLNACRAAGLVKPRTRRED